jgi:hypothetical protein
MASYPPHQPVGVPEPRNSSRVKASDIAAIDTTHTYLFTVRRSPIIIPFFPGLSEALTSTAVAGDDPWECRIRLAPYNERVQWGICAVGHGEVYVQASAAPAAEGFSASLPVYNSEGEIQQSQGWTFSPNITATPSADGEQRPIVAQPATSGQWETQDIEVWCDDDAGGSVSVLCFGLMLYPVPRMTSDGALV